MIYCLRYLVAGLRGVMPWSVVVHWPGRFLSLCAGKTFGILFGGCLKDNSMVMPNLPQKNRSIVHECVTSGVHDIPSFFAVTLGQRVSTGRGAFCCGSFLAVVKCEQKGGDCAVNDYLLSELVSREINAFVQNNIDGIQGTLKQQIPNISNRELEVAQKTIHITLNLCLYETLRCLDDLGVIKLPPDGQAILSPLD